MSGFPYNPAHPIGTCADCGGEMVFNVPRMGPAGGYVHKDTRAFLCSGIAQKGDFICDTLIQPRVPFCSTEIKPIGLDCTDLRTPR